MCVMTEQTSIEQADLHAHFSFAKNFLELCAFARTNNRAVFSTTVTPQDFCEARQQLLENWQYVTEDRVDQLRHSLGAVQPSGYDACGQQVSCDGQSGFVLGLGLHPWWVREDRLSFQIDAFDQLAVHTPFIGEIGLDYSERFSQYKDAQLAVFRHIIEGLSSGSVVSIHAVRSASDVLQILDEKQVYKHNCCIMHWFSGSSDELERAIEMGCYFSVNERMLNTKRGRASVRTIPPSRLLLESDWPPSEQQSANPHEWLASLRRTQDALEAELEMEIGEQLLANSMYVLRFPVCKTMGEA